MMMKERIREIDNRYDSVTNYNDRAKFTADPPLTGRQLRNKRRKLRQKAK
jgi:hypothetical protein